jgi:hypothetical protein
MRIIFSVFLVLYVSTTSLAQDKDIYGFDVRMMNAAGTLGETQESGIGFGFCERINIGMPSMRIAFGYQYVILPGKTKSNSEGHGQIPGVLGNANLKYLQLFWGPCFGKTSGPYFLPAITGVFIKQNGNRYGVDLGTGYLFIIPDTGLRLDIKANYSILNILGKEKGYWGEDEKVKSVFCLGLGICF